MAVHIELPIEPELEVRMRERADALGLSPAEYLSTLVTNDLGQGMSSNGHESDPPKKKGDISEIFDLGYGGPSNIRENKHEMIAEAIAHHQERKMSRE